MVAISISFYSSQNFFFYIYLVRSESWQTSYAELTVQFAEMQ